VSAVLETGTLVLADLTGHTAYLRRRLRSPEAAGGATEG